MSGLSSSLLFFFFFLRRALRRNAIRLPPPAMLEMLGSRLAESFPFLFFFFFFSSLVSPGFGTQRRSRNHRALRRRWGSKPGFLPPPFPPLTRGAASHSSFNMQFRAGVVLPASFFSFSHAIGRRPRRRWESFTFPFLPLGRQKEGRVQTAGLFFFPPIFTKQALGGSVPAGTRDSFLPFPPPFFPMTVYIEVPHAR